MGKGPAKPETFPRLTEDWLRRINNLLPHRYTDSHTAKAYHLAVPALRKVFGGEWSERYVESATTGFLRNDRSTPHSRETHFMRAAILVEMLWNLQDVEGFKECASLIKRGQIESTYAVLEIARMLFARNIAFRFVKPTGKRGESYDLELIYPDGVKACGEAKCKMEDTDITLDTIRESLRMAREQLPKSEPGIAFIKVPRQWLDDIQFAASLTDIANQFFNSTDRIVSVKYHTAVITFKTVAGGLAERVAEIVAHNEITSPHVHRRFPHLKGKEWTLFPENEPPPEHGSFSGMPPHWKRLFFFR